MQKPCFGEELKRWLCCWDPQLGRILKIGNGGGGVTKSWGRGCVVALCGERQPSRSYVKRGAINTHYLVRRALTKLSQEFTRNFHKHCSCSRKKLSSERVVRSFVRLFIHVAILRE